MAKMERMELRMGIVVVAKMLLHTQTVRVRRTTLMLDDFGLEAMVLAL
jgi:hypothetical protein